MFRTRNYQVPLTHYHGAKQIHHHQIFRGIKSWNKGPNLYRAYMPIWDGPIFGVTIILQRIMTFIICQSVQWCYSIRTINHLTVPNKTEKRLCGCTWSINVICLLIGVILNKIIQCLALFLSKLPTEWIWTFSNSDRFLIKITKIWFVFRFDC